MKIQIPLTLLVRICKAFLELRKTGGTCGDQYIFEDLDNELKKYDI